MATAVFLCICIVQITIGQTLLLDYSYKLWKDLVYRLELELIEELRTVLFRE